MRADRYTAWLLCLVTPAVAAWRAAPLYCPVSALTASLTVARQPTAAALTMRSDASSSSSSFGATAAAALAGVAAAAAPGPCTSDYRVRSPVPAMFAPDEAATDGSSSRIRGRATVLCRLPTPPDSKVLGAAEAEDAEVLPQAYFESMRYAARSRLTYDLGEVYS